MGLMVVPNIDSRENEIASYNRILESAGGFWYDSPMKLFLSHATQDSIFVDVIRQRLEPLNVKVYGAEFDNKAGANLLEKVRSEIRSSDWIVVLLTNAGHASVYVHQEIGFALAEKKLVIPIVTPEIARENLGMLNGTEYIVYDAADPDSAFHQLTQRIDELARRQMKLQKDKDDLIEALVVGLAVGAILLALRE